MKVQLAEHSGFCFGVMRAIDIAKQARDKGKEVFTLGELIHNPGIVSRLEQSGIKVCHDINTIRESTVVIRSHGVSPSDESTLFANGNNVIDATCPYVKRIQKLVASMTDKGYTVLILGDAGHPEVIGIRAYGKDRAIVVSADGSHDLIGSEKLCLVSQTTGSVGAIQAMAARLVPECSELRIFNTICLATSQRQESAIKLAKTCDLMVVIGGHNSSNTKQLTKLCGKFCISLQIETAGELNASDLLDKQSIGITAGASTPAEAILEVYNKIKEIIGDPDRATCIGEIPLFKEESC